jgi:CelD/BcsL family acetyltransferase involved in cellulose biosynthesis
MEIKLHRDFSEIDQTLWDQLLSQSATDVPFLKYGYLAQWWLNRGGGEWPQEARIFILTGWEGSALKGIAPLFSVRENSREILYLLGSIEISDYLDFIARPEDLKGFISSVLAFIQGAAEPLISQLILVNIPENSPTNSLLQELGPQFGWTVKSENAHHAPAISLAGDWDAYLAGIDKKQRHEIRRKLRKADESTEVKWYYAEDPAALDSEINAFFDLMILDEPKKKFLTPQMRDQMRAIIHWAFDAGILRLSFLTIEGIKAASYLCFDYKDAILVYNSGFDFRFSQYSPGWVLLGYLIQNAIQNGKKCFDFMRGGEDYKYRFGAANSFVMRVELNKS